jgi:hypothetical protein
VAENPAPTPEEKPKRLYEKILITGACRSGTKYAAEVFSRCGVLATHETVLKEVSAQEWSGTQVECSCWAPFHHSQKRLNLDETLVIHQVRNPLKSIASNAAHWEHLLRDVFYSGARPLHEQSDHVLFPQLMRYPEPYPKSMAYYVLINQYIEAHFDPFLTWKVEEYNVPSICNALLMIGVTPDMDRVEEALRVVPKKNNPLPDYCNRGFYSCTLEDLPEIPLRQQLANLIARYGYV